ncbi:hypothetical protein L208DRAFT_1374372 [Tricholoma matsutake]|nr:hypothetical protein L208DRAFT_1374372 [Tricholoma matsutake 945]
MDDQEGVFGPHYLTEDEIDAEMLRWLCPPQHQAEHDELVATHRCEDANKALCGALVEVHFMLKHYHIKWGGYDSFTGVPLQVHILKRGVRPSICCDIRAGPVMLTDDNKAESRKAQGLTLHTPLPPSLMVLPVATIILPEANEAVAVVPAIARHKWS